MASKCARSPRKCRSDKFMVETDCPYLAPVPFRGKRANRPTPDWWRKRSRARAEFRWKKSLAQPPQLRKNFSGLIAGETGMRNDRASSSRLLTLPPSLCSSLASCAAPTREHHIVISVHDQKLALLEEGNLVATYPVSTSKFGLGDRREATDAAGRLEIADKIGDGAPTGTVFKDRRRTGEIVARERARARSDRDANHLAARTGSAKRQCLRRDIYIHGTPEERNIGRPASYGCIRMRSRRHHQSLQHRRAGRAGHDRRCAARS